VTNSLFPNIISYYGQININSKDVRGKLGFHPVAQTFYPRRSPHPPVGLEEFFCPGLGLFFKFCSEEIDIVVNL